MRVKVPALAPTMCEGRKPDVLSPASHALDLDDVGGLKALGALDHFEFDGRAFLEIAIPVSLDGGIVDKNVFTLAALDEAVPLGGVEPLDSSLLSIAAHVYFCSFKFDAVCSPGPLRLKIKRPRALPAALHFDAKGTTRATNASLY